MIIKKINISNFGNLSDFEISPSKGLNIIYAPNESGKTTLLSFVKYILYGTKQKKMPNKLRFKEKFMPWNGLPMSGSCMIEKNGESYTVQRQDGDNLSRLSVFDNQSGETLRDIAVPGSYFTGVGERAFSDSCFVTEIDSISDLSSDGELVSVLSDSYDNKNTYTKMHDTLNERLQQLVSPKRKSSELSIIEKKIDDYRDKLRITNEKIIKLNGIINSLNDAEIRINILRAENERLCRIKNKLEYENLTSEIASLQSEKEEVEKQLEDMDKSGIHEKKYVTDIERSLILADFSEYKNDIAELKHRKIKNIIFAVLFVGLSLFSVFAALYTVWFAAAFPVLLALSGLYVRKYVISQKMFRLKADELADFRNKQKKVRDKYGLKDYSDCVAFVSSIHTKGALELHNEKREFLCKRIEYILNTIISRKSRLDEIKYIPDDEHVDINCFTNRDINGIIKDNEKIIHELSHEVNRDLHYRNELSDLKNDMINISSAITKLEVEKKLVIENAEVLELAMKILDNAFIAAKNTVFPDISQKTQAIFDAVTQNGINSVSADENFSLSFSKDGFMRDAGFLSKGTLDVLYFSLRIAIIDIMSCDGAGIPVFLDDVLSNCDDERAFRLLELIYKLSQYHQIFLCTCRSREGEYFKDKSDVNIIRMQKG